MRTRKLRSTIIALAVAFPFMLLIMLSIAPQYSWAEDGDYEPVPSTQTKGEEEEEGKLQSICPKTLMKETCMSCHTKDWRTKEVAWDAHIDYPYNTKIYKELKEHHTKIWGHYLLTSVDADTVKGVLDFFDEHNITYAVFEIQSYGGSAFEMWRIMGLMNSWKTHDKIIETRVNGMAISAGFGVFVSGSKGYRLVNPHAELMWHEAQAFEWPEITNPSKTEEKARVYRHIQDNSNTYIASVSNMTKEEIDEKVNFREFWMTGKEAIQFGFADGFIGE